MVKPSLRYSRSKVLWFFWDTLYKYESLLFTVSSWNHTCTLKLNISASESHRKPKLGSIECMSMLNNILKGQLIWSNHLWDIQDQKCCVFLRHPVLVYYFNYMKKCTKIDSYVVNYILCKSIYSWKTQNQLPLAKGRNSLAYTMYSACPYHSYQGRIQR